MTTAARYTTSLGPRVTIFKVADDGTDLPVDIMIGGSVKPDEAPEDAVRRLDYHRTEGATWQAEDNDDGWWLECAPNPGAERRALLRELGLLDAQRAEILRELKDLEAP